MAFGRSLYYQLTPSRVWLPTGFEEGGNPVITHFRPYESLVKHTHHMLTSLLQAEALLGHKSYRRGRYHSKIHVDLYPRGSKVAHFRPEKGRAGRIASPVGAMRLRWTTYATMRERPGCNELRVCIYEKNGTICV